MASQFYKIENIHKHDWCIFNFFEIKYPNQFLLNIFSSYKKMNK